MTTRLFIVTIGVLIGFPVVWGCSEMAAKEPSQKPAGAVETNSDKPMPPIEATVIRSQGIDLPPELADPQKLKPGGLLTLCLFDDEYYESRIVKTYVDVQGTWTVMADVQTPDQGHLIAVAARGRWLIDLRLTAADRQYLITYDEETDAYRADELALESLPPKGPDVLVPPEHPTEE